MTFGAAMDYIQTVSKKGSVLGLDTTRELLRRVGNPQDQLRFVHIAGTNGKGSALAYISTILTCAGYRTGRYISPVIYSYNEKIQVDGESISNEAITGLVEVLKEACDAMVRDGFEQPTVFEIETAMAFLYFLNEQCDIAVIETGMGGRDDSTNVIPAPLCEVLMSISLDHVGIIGNDLTEITLCKAGIIKENSDVVLYHQSDLVMDLVKKVCEEKNSRLVITKPETLFLKEDSLHGQVFDYNGMDNAVIHLLGEHQIRNAAVAIEVMGVLRQRGMTILDDAIRQGLEYTRWPGRFEVVNNRPLIIMDGAHNPDGARTLRDCVGRYLNGYTKIFVMGVLRDKDYETIIKLTNSLADAIITINPDNPRALSDEELKDAINRLKTRDIPVLSAGRIESGIEAASQIAMQLDHNRTAIVVFGSLSFLGDLGRYLYR
ncbi:MAG: bifunctional folylpolyglutamate synthase/dihydrofolate synthase [Lachnospiraceae bacterium]